jgi:hypothetical protein
MAKQDLDDIQEFLRGIRSRTDSAKKRTEKVKDSAGTKKMANISDAVKEAEDYFGGQGDAQQM